MAASRSEALARQGRATDQDVLDAPAHQVAEIVDGTLPTQPRPAVHHTRASSSLGAKIGGPFDYDAGGPGGWWILNEAERRLGEALRRSLIGARSPGRAGVRARTERPGNAVRRSPIGAALP